MTNPRDFLVTSFSVYLCNGQTRSNGSQGRFCVA